MSIILISCKKTEFKIQNSAQTVYNDSIICLSGLNILDNFNKLDSVKAKETLNNHFRKKGYLIEKELEFETFDPESPENYGKKAIDYLSITKFKFKNKFIALISYYNCEPFANGNCVEPHYAIISSTQLEYKISNEEFLSSHFRIDSIKNINNDAIVFGYNFECGNKKVLKHYRVLLK